MISTPICASLFCRRPIARSLPGNDARRKDHRVAGLEHDLGMLVLGDAPQRGARLALAAGADQHHLVARQIGGLLVGQERQRYSRDSRSRARRDPCATASARPAPRGDRWQPRRAAIEASRATFEAKHATATRSLQLADQLDQASFARRPRSPLRPAASRWSNCTTIASTPSSPRRRSAASSAVGPTSGSGSNFQSPVWSTVPKGVRNDNGVRLGDRVGHRDQLEIELPDREPSRHRHFVQRHFVLEPRFRQLGAQHRRGERRGIDRTAQTPPQMGHRADMVLMRMGQHEPVEPVGAFGDERRDRA